jgi:hypothetical protein
VTCGNSLSGETRFAYRIGSFFHDGPNGRRRGVIREVAPEQTPVPFLQQHTRDQSENLFATQAEEADDDGEAVSLPTIVEVPRWLARMERALTTGGDHEDESSPREIPQTQKPERKSQQRLF